MPQDMSPVSRGEAMPLFELTTFLSGRTRAWGVFQDRFGRVRRRIAVEMYGRWHDGRFVLDERFVYDDSIVETRTWDVYPLGAGRFRATCADCVGEATGMSTTDGIHMSYRFRLKLESRELVVAFDDRLYRVDDDVAVNRATMRKWGVKLGELFLVFQRVPVADDEIPAHATPGRDFKAGQPA
jgi:hypothetical protein